MRSSPDEVMVDIIRHQLNLELSAGIKTPRVPMRGREWWKDAEIRAPRTQLEVAM
jgi:hypothetical protein